MAILPGTLSYAFLSLLESLFCDIVWNIVVPATPLTWCISLLEFWPIDWFWDLIAVRLSVLAIAKSLSLFAFKAVGDNPWELPGSFVAISL